MRKGSGFSYRSPNGSLVRDATTRRRIRALAIPPAWTRVWIATDAAAHLQATGRDAKGRKQYRYHPAYRAHRDQEKFDRLAEFGEALPLLRRQIRQGLALRGVSRERVLAALAYLLDTTFARVGNPEYERANRSFGLTTLHSRHARRAGKELRLSFRGKSGIAQELSVDDPRVVRIIRRCQELPGQALFQYLEESGERSAIDAGDVNDWIRQGAKNEQITAKDFRTWHGSVLAFEALKRAPPPSSIAEGQRVLNEVVDQIADRLGNTRAVCRRYYIHGGLVEAFLDGKLAAAVAKLPARRRRGLSLAESQLLAWLKS
jgi:DNA topoisomerase-1